MRSVAVVGSGISGLVAAYELAKAGLKVCLYEKDDKLGGHANTAATVHGVQLDLGFTLFNRVTSPNMMELFESLGIEMEDSDMSFSVSLDMGLGCEWGTRNGLSSIFSQKKNLLNPYFWKMLRELTKFKNDILIYLDEQENTPKMDRTKTLGSFIKSKGYSELFQRAYLIPMCASIWPCDSQQVMDFPAFSILSCFRDNHMLQLLGGPQWLTVKGGSHCYINKVMKELVDRGCQIKTDSEVHYVSTSDEGCKITLDDGSKDVYDGCILATSAFNALKILGQQATHDERKTLGAFQCFYSDVFLHQDKSFMPRNETAWSALNFVGSSNGQISLTYWLNVIQIPMCASIWPCDSQQVMDFPAFSILSCFRDNHMLQLLGGPQWLTVKGGSHCYINKVMKELVDRGCQIKTDSEVHYVSTSDEGCKITLDDGSKDVYDGCILATSAFNALKILGQQATHDERKTLGVFQCFYSDVFLHQDKSFMPRNETAWSALNFVGSSNGQISLTYWLNVIQNVDMGDEPFLVTLNPLDVPKNVLMKWSSGHHIPSVAASKASLEMNNIQGKRRIWFSGAYLGYGFLEDGLKASMVVAHEVLGRNCIVLQNPKQMVTSWAEAASRIVTTRFLRRFISTGCLTILENGGEVLTFQGTSKKFAPKVAIRVHDPQFYRKVCLEADLGLADAYINGDFSLVDKNEGLLNLFMLFITNSDSGSSDSGGPYKKRNWWTPILFTSSIASAKYMYRHFRRQNSLTQARRNISRHYDLSNDIFSLFLGETMQYSCAMFKSINEDLREAQLRKMCVLIKKARIEGNHEVLEIGFGWGNLAIEVVKRTGCKYTGITISEEQLRYAEKRVEESGFQDRIKLLLCDYRELPHVHKYDRIISCEMIEHVGHEYMEDFFRCCDSVLTDNGLFILQFNSYRDYSYDEYRRGPGFIKEYIFPGGCLPCLSRVTSAMAAASMLCVEEVENIGAHYYQTLRCWRKNFLQQQRKLLSLGFDEKFIRTWEYYFDYCTAGYNSRMIHNYQVIFSRPRHVVANKNPYEGVSSLSSC